MADVLLIEDDDAQRLIAGFALRKAGHQVREAQDGEEGLAAARNARPEAIVCDVMMPGITGYEVLAELRRDGELATVPVILLTALSDRQHMRQGMTSGADDYLTKPYRPEELCAAVEAVLARRQVQEDAFRSTLSGALETALEEQKETLARKYESQLQREINARWMHANAATDLHYPRAFVLLADLLGAGSGPEPALAERLKQAQRAARDTVYLFGATQVLPYGARLMAVFPTDTDSASTPAELRVLRAALALVKAPRDAPASVSIHTGAVALVAVHDGLHGDNGYALVPGDAVNTVVALEELATASGWRIATSEAMARVLGRQAALGRRARTPRGDAAVEITGAGPAAS
jgi:DNA-binding response OmpR family regulator